MTIRVGTASWTDKTLIACGRFYPPGVSTARERLQFYAARFSMVEIDSSYYALPDPLTAHQWAQRTPADFTFNIKAYRLFTGHRTPAAALTPDIRRALGAHNDAMLDYRDIPVELRDELWRRFLLAVEPLRMAGKLGAVHFQFAPGIRCDAAGIGHVRHCARVMEENDMAVEFRHASWFDAPRRASTLGMLRELGAAHVVVDSPQGFSNTVPAVWDTTHPELAVVRLHGRNAAAWNQRGVAASSGRFIYEYTEDELRDLAAQIARLAQTIANTHVVFNTNYQDQGMKNAAAFKEVLHTQI